MNILQVSAPKTGSYWLNTILTKILQKKNLKYTFFIQQQPVYRELKDLKLSFRNQASVDMIDIQEDGYFYRVSSLIKEPIEDNEIYAENAALAWTHSTWCSQTRPVFDLFEKKVCIVRDPRDRALSASKFAFTQYMQRYYPSQYISQTEFLNAEFERLIEQWTWFYGNYLLHSEELDLHFIYYENLLSDFDLELEKLLEYLQLELSSSEKAEIKAQVTFSSMKEKSPRHLQKGKSRKWVEELNDNQKTAATKKAGELMQLFGYPLSSADPDKKLTAPQPLPKNELQDMLEKIEWQGLF